MPTRDQFTDGESFKKALRDWFAGQAIVGMFAVCDVDQASWPDPTMLIRFSPITTRS